MLLNGGDIMIWVIMFCSIFGVSILIIVATILVAGAKDRKREQIRNEKIRKINNEIDRLRDAALTQNPAAIGTQIYETKLIDGKTPVKIWKTDTSLVSSAHPFIKIADVDHAEISGCVATTIIPFARIQSFQRSGSIYTTTDPSGKTNNAKGAMVGALIGGVTGAVIGNAVNTGVDTLVHDNRCVTLYYIDDTETPQNIKYTDDAYDVFMALIPDKEYSVVASHPAKADSAESPADRLTAIKTLRERELITEDEYQAKKKEILKDL